VSRGTIHLTPHSHGAGAAFFYPQSSKPPRFSVSRAVISDRRGTGGELHGNRGGKVLSNLMLVMWQALTGAGSQAVSYR